MKLINADEIVIESECIIWIYSFEDGTELKLLDTEFSMQEIGMLIKLHGRCFATYERVRM